MLANPPTGAMRQSILLSILLKEKRVKGSKMGVKGNFFLEYN